MTPVPTVLLFCQLGRGIAESSWYSPGQVAHRHWLRAAVFRVIDAGYATPPEAPTGGQAFPGRGLFGLVIAGCGGCPVPGGSAQAGSSSGACRPGRQRAVCSKRGRLRYAASVYCTGNAIWDKTVAECPRSDSKGLIHLISQAVLPRFRGRVSCKEFRWPWAGIGTHVFPQRDGLFRVESGSRHEHQSDCVRLTFLSAVEWQLQPQLRAIIDGLHGSA